MEIISQTLDWISIHPFPRMSIALLLLITTGGFYHRITRGTGKLGFLLMSFMAIAVFVVSPALQLLALLIVLFGLLLTRGEGRFRDEYSPAVIRMEGGGAKRGLAPAEGAVLLGRPFHVSLTIAVLGMLHKGILILVRTTPLKVKLANSLRTRGRGISLDARQAERRKAAQALKIVIQPYEELLIEFLEDQADGALAEYDYGIILRPFVNSVVARLGGYNLEETRNYYRLIVQRAPLEARSEGELTADRKRVFDHNFGWVLLHEDVRSILDDGETAYAPDWFGDTDSGEGHAPTFAQWVAALMESMKAAIPAGSEFEGIAEADSVAGRLLDDILKATYFR